ncbi:nitrate reductase molybdenum cofactor assembly chaperone [Pseudomonas asuensis]|uniref:Nitrate reductase molybdenum cofactor assembly chaperone n=1 Tax=Pseudomonas asuensis TaxID=1825787 RepID=A0ABQ2GX81_9PSED|nr:nitrate reductase molybdenum cofactor assembly chaperone [Pseudomonas asuensis]GGM16579.1 nitrate reductase molybdenum cofactor assembly chaperone [Pseudomonas asuensis]
MRILKVISLLMDYPTEALAMGRQELASAIKEAREISPEQRRHLQALLDQLTDSALMDVQEAYTELFDRGRSLSLLLFEHVHGESRDRGQAMVDLLAQYEAAGFSLGVKELPDYLPLYLEYLATRDALAAREGLGDISHLLALLAARLAERRSPYAACFTALLQVAGETPIKAVEALREQVASESRDDSLEALDKVWEEEAVDFLKAEQEGRCGAQPSRPGKAKQEEAVPLHWIDFNQETPAQAPVREAYHG